MANVIQLKAGTAAPAGGITKSELVIRHVDAAHTTSSSSMLYIGEDADDDGVTIRALGTGMTGDSGQGGATIGGSMTFTGGNAVTTSVSGAAVTINHDDTSSQSSVNNSGANFIQDITLDTYGHVTGITSASAGSGSGDMTGVDLTGGTGITISSESNTTSGDYSATIAVTDGSIDTTQLAADSVTAAKIADDVINSEHYAAGSIDNEHIADDAINSEHYAAGSIDTAHIADDQVTYAKIQNVSATNRILGRDSASAGVIEEITPANLRTMINVADGATANAGTVTSVGTGTGLTGTVTSSGNLSLSHLGIESLSDPGADRLLIWDDSAGAIVFATPNSNLAISGTNVNATDTNTTYSVGDGGLTTNDFTNADHSKLNGIEASATADQTKSDINGLAITTVGTIDSGVWNGTAIASAYLDSDTAHLSGTQTHTGAKTFSGGVTLSGTTTHSGILDITNTTDSSDDSGDTGALRVEGGASIAKKLYVGTDLDVDGTTELDNITIGGQQGTDGQVLTSTGSGVAWEDASGGGGGGGFDTAGTGLTSSGTTVNVIGGTGVTANANDIAIGQAVGTTDNVVFGKVDVDSSTGHVQLNNGYVEINGNEGEEARILLFADQGDDNADKWKIHNTPSNQFEISSKTSGSYVNQLTLTNAAQLTLGQASAQNGRYQVVSGANVLNGVTGSFDIPTDFFYDSMSGTINVVASQTITVTGGLITNIG